MPSYSITMCPNSAQPRNSFPSSTTPPPQPVPSVSITIELTSRPAPEWNSPYVAAFASFSIPTGSENRSAIRARKSRPSSGILIETRRHAEPECDHAVVEQGLDCGIEPGEERILRLGRRGRLPAAFDRAVRGDDPREDLGAAEIDADDAGLSQELGSECLAR